MVSVIRTHSISKRLCVVLTAASLLSSNFAFSQTNNEAKTEQSSAQDSQLVPAAAFGSMLSLVSVMSYNLVPLVKFTYHYGSSITKGVGVLSIASVFVDAAAQSFYEFSPVSETVSTVGKDYIAPAFKNIGKGAVYFNDKAYTAVLAVSDAGKRLLNVGAELVLTPVVAAREGFLEACKETNTDPEFAAQVVAGEVAAAVALPWAIKLLGYLGSKTAAVSSDISKDFEDRVSEFSSEVSSDPSSRNPLVDSLAKK